MIKIDDNVPMTASACDFAGAIIIESVPLPAEARKQKINRSMQKVIDRYNSAYQIIHGVPAHIEYEAPWFKVSGHDARVSKARLLEMAKQLEYRAG